MHLDLSSPESVEQLRRSLVMLTPRVWALRREDAVTIVQALLVALEELRRLEHLRGD